MDKNWTSRQGVQDTASVYDGLIFIYNENLKHASIIQEKIFLT